MAAMFNNFLLLFLVFNAASQGYTEYSDTLLSCSIQTWIANTVGVCVAADNCSGGGSPSGCSGGLVCCLELNIQNLASQLTTASPFYPGSLQSEIKNQVCGRRHPQGVGFRSYDPDALEFAFFGEFPWTVAVLSERPEDQAMWAQMLQGGGSLIGPRVVLTAAHIVKGIRDTPLKIRAGEHDTEIENIMGYIESHVENVIIHEDYKNDTLANDIALLILTTPIEANEYIGYACLPKTDEKAPIGGECFSTGWGKDENKGTIQKKMKRITLPIVKRRECLRALRKSELGPFFSMGRSVLCAGGNTVDTCRGDGGAPLVCPVPDKFHRYKQFGIVSGGAECGDGKTPGVYTKVSDFRNWIDNKMSDHGFPHTTYIL